MRITKNQIELLDVIQSFRYLPLKVLVKIAKKQGLYSFRQNVSPVVRKFEYHGIVRSFRYGNNEKVVYITPKGAKRLAFELGISVSEILVPNQGQKVRFAMLEHTVEIAGMYGEFVKALRNYPSISLDKWEGDQRIRCQYKYKSRKTQKKISRNLVPDSYFSISKHDQSYGYFLEYDTGTMDRDQLAFKFMRYFEYFKYGDWEERFKTFPSIIFITERSKQRLDNLLIKPEVDIDQALKSRKLFQTSKHILWGGIGKTDNLRSMKSQSIREFLNLNFTFQLKDTSWAESLLKNLE